jgi:hypothetical protein
MKMIIARLVVVLAAASLCLLVEQPPAGAQTGPKDEVKCQSGVSKTTCTFFKKKAKCISKCVKTQRKSSGPYAGCFAPYADPATNACIMDPSKGAEPKAEAKIIKLCSKDCPECGTYPSTCATGNPAVSSAETVITGFAPQVWCTENGGGTPTSDQAKCEDTVGTELSKFQCAKLKCYAKCHDAESKGKIPFGSCNPGAVSDPTGKTQECISKAESKSAAKIDSKCAGASANPPCYIPARDTGAEWVALWEASVDSGQGAIWCGSASQAFLDRPSSLF